MTQGASKQFLRFCAVGAAGFCVDAAVLYLVAPVAGWYVGRVLSFWAAATATWMLNRNFTFQAQVQSSEDRRVVQEYLAYLASMLGGAAVNYLAYLLTLRFVHLPGTPLLGVAAGSCAGLIVNFLVARHLVFSTTSGKRR